MSLTKLTKDLSIISKLSDEPNDTDGLTADELKAKFDESGNSIKDYLNNTLTSELDNAIGESYKKPDGGIPKTDLSSDVQTSLSKADTALQAGALPAGGTDGDVLVKNGETDYAAKWTNAPDKNIVVVIGDSWSAPNSHWLPYFAAKYPKTFIKNYAVVGARIRSQGNPTMNTQVTQAIDDTSFNHNKVAKIILMGLVNDLGDVDDLYAATAQGIGNQIVTYFDSLKESFPYAEPIAILTHTRNIYDVAYQFTNEIVKTVVSNGYNAVSAIGWLSRNDLGADYVHPNASGDKKLCANIATLIFGGKLYYVSDKYYVSGTNNGVTYKVVWEEVFGSDSVYISTAIETSNTSDIQFSFDLDQDQMPLLVPTGQIYFNRVIPFFAKSGVELNCTASGQTRTRYWRPTNWTVGVASDGCVASSVTPTAKGAYFFGKERASY